MDYNYFDDLIESIEKEKKYRRIGRLLFYGVIIIWVAIIVGYIATGHNLS